MFYKKARKIEEIFTVDLTVYNECQIDGEDFFKFCGLLRKHELYLKVDMRQRKILEKLCHCKLEYLQQNKQSALILFAKT